MALFSKLPVNKKEIEQAIAMLEQRTSAELRVFIEGKMPKKMKTAFERAFQVFQELEMDNTLNRNAVLIYIAYKDHQCTIIGDEGIHQFVGEQFWQQTCEAMITYFKRAAFTLGICHGIEKIGNELVQHFPVQEDDVNELPNEVIIHD